MTDTYWNKAIETLSSKALEAYEAPLLQQQIQYLYERSPYYRQKLDDAGVSPEEIKQKADLAKLPFTDKQDLANAQREGALIGPHQCADMSDIVRLVGTGGTSGQPLRIGWTRKDIAGYNEMAARALWAMGCRPSDLIVNCFNYSIYAGGIMDHMGFETLGASVLAYGVGKSRQLLDMLADLPGDKCLYSTPSYAIRLAELAINHEIDPSQLGVRKGFFSGEAGLQVPGYRDRIERLWGMSARDLYGVAELGCQSGECDEHNGMHFTGAGWVTAELIDPDSGAVIDFKEGSTGELVYTAIKRQASPLLRMRSRDFVQVFTDPCGCGRTSFRFQTLGRSDDMFVIKGVNVFPTAIQALLIDMRPKLTGEFQISLDQPPPFDYSPRLITEVDRTFPAEQYDALINEIQTEIQRRIGFKAEVELVDQGTIASEHKTKRVLRPYKGHL